MRLRNIILTALLLSTFAASAHAIGVPRAPVELKSSLQGLVRSGSLPDLHWPGFTDFRPEVERLYGQTAWTGLWLDGVRPTRGATKLIARLAASDSLGLDPADYDAQWLFERADELATRREAPAKEDLARFDLALTVSALRFASALHVGRVNPAELDNQLYVPPPSDRVELAVDSLRNSHLQAGVLRRLQPSYAEYQRLKNGLAQYKLLALDTTLVLLPGTPTDLRPGMPLRSAPRLRRLLEATGDLAPLKKLPKGKGKSKANANANANADTVYTPALAEGVKSFQRRHGFEPDGVLWRSTLLELGRPMSERIHQIELALERWRWMPPAFEAPPVIVNIPAFRLAAYKTADNRDDDALTMDVLVGAAIKSETPVFSAPMKYLVFRPFWEMPADLQLYEFAPMALTDRENLERLGYVLVSSNDPGAPNLPLTPENVKKIGKGLRMRQLPGENNALGLLKFMLPNDRDIYLHDTPVKGLFAFARRDISHGCVRVSNPVALALHVLRDQPDWTEERVKEMMAGEDNVRVDLTQPVPVYMFYATATASGSGEMSFYNDIYRLDEKLNELLVKGYPYPKRIAGVPRREPQGRISTEVPTGTTR